MTLDGFLTLLSLLAAIYAVMSAAQRLQLRIRLGWLQYGFLAVSFVAINYLQLYEPIKQAGYGIPSAIPRFGLRPQTASYLVVIAAATIVALSLRFSRVRTSDLGKLTALVPRLIEDKHYADLITILSDALPAVVKSRKDQFLSSRLRHAFRPQNDPRILLVEAEVDQLLGNGTGPTRFQRLSANVRGRFWGVAASIVQLLPRRERDVLAAREILRIVLFSDTTSQFIASSRPYFAIDIFRSGIFEASDFAENVLSLLIADPHSVLYFEVRHNQNDSYAKGYYYDPSNRLLHYLFADATNAYELEVWRPVGEHVIRSIRSSKDFLNADSEGFREHDEWRNPIFVGIRFFDLMVRAALHQNIQWHMWLYYFPHFVEALVSVYDDSGTNINKGKEWPTRGSYLLYQAFDALRGWIKSLEYIPAGQENRVLRTEAPEHENGNIVKSAMIALGQCLKHVAMAQNIDGRFKCYLFDICMRLLRDFHQKPRHERYTAALVNTLVSGGAYAGSDAAAYRSELATLFRQLDHVLQFDLRFFQARL